MRPDRYGDHLKNYLTVDKGQLTTFNIVDISGERVIWEASTRVESRVKPAVVLPAAWLTFLKRSGN